jgi:hypothetical protein
MGGSFARGGFLDREGTQVGGLRQVPEYGAWLARPQITMGPAGAVLLYDDYSLEGFRTFAFWEHQYPESGAMPPPLGGGARERAVHNGWADDALVVLVTSAPDAWVVVASTEPLTRSGVVQRAEGTRPAE